MKEIICPKCKTPFQVDDSMYASIVEQVRNDTFNAEMKKREEDMRKQFEAQREADKIRAEKEFDHKLSENNDNLSKLQNELTRLQGIIDAHDAAKKSELAELETKNNKNLFESISRKDKEIADLKAQLAGKESEFQVKLLEEKSASRQELLKKEQQLTEVKAEKEKSLAELRAEIKAEKLTAENREAQLREAHKLQLQDKQEEIDRLKDMRFRLSTKMVGESLEQHCYNLFIDLQTQGLYRSATLIKDNTVVDHSKGDFIFRDYIDGEEYISIMFEMKNEMDTTATKHKNSDFFDKLDKDRTRKNCEYAILVSMLEQESEMYNRGIVDMSHLYPKMMVIRPQFFMTIIQILSDAARKGYNQNKALIMELEVARNQTRDFTRFEERINKFRDSFNKNVMAAHKKFNEATEGIDNAIKGLEKQIEILRKVKQNFEVSEQKLLRANEVADEKLTVKSLTRGLKSIRNNIEDASENQD